MGKEVCFWKWGSCVLSCGWCLSLSLSHTRQDRRRKNKVLWNHMKEVLQKIRKVFGKDGATHDLRG